MHYIGIDLGTTNSSLCYTGYDEAMGRYADPVPVRLGKEPTTRSILLLDESGQHIVQLGEEVYQAPDFLRHPERVHEEFKPLIGKDPLAVDCARLLCGQLLERFQRVFNLNALPQPSEFRTAVGVPVHWATDEPERAELVRRAVEAAGFPSVEVLPEPVGAMLYHAYQGDITFEFRSQHWLVIDFGGGTIDLAVVETAAGGEQPRVIATFGKQFGGKDFDQLLLDKLVLSQYWQGAPPDRFQRLELLQWVRQFKEKFSQVLGEGGESHSARLKLAGIRETVTLNRHEFENDDLAGPLIRNFRSILIEAFSNKSRDVALQDIDRVILTGGSARWYFVRETVEGIWRRGVVRSENPELAIAKGLALALTGFQMPCQQVPVPPVQIDASSPSDSSQTIERILHSASVVEASKLDLPDCRRRAGALVNKYTVGGGIVAFLASPIPGLSHFPLTAIETKLVADISVIYGYKLQGGQVATVVASLLAGGMLIKVGVTELLTFVPTFGWVIKGGVAVAAIKALGEAVIKYFEDQRRRELSLPASVA